MHVILTIAKIIGIVLLVVLALLLVLLLAVLFVPLRYRVRVRREDDPLKVQARVSWLLRLVRLDVTWQDKAGEVVLKVLWLRLKTFRFPDREEAPEQTADRAQRAETPEQTAGRAQKAEAPEQTADRAQTAETPEEPAARAQIPDAREKPSGEPSGGEASGTSGQGEPSGFGDRLRAIIRVLPEWVQKGIERLFDLLLRLCSLPFDVYNGVTDRTDRLVKKGEDLWKKADPFLRPEGRRVLRKLLRQVQYLLKGYRPRRLTGYVRFGTGQPDVTGRLTGLLYVLLPSGGSTYRIEPDFYEKLFQTDTALSGVIRAYRVVVVLVRLVLDKEVRMLVRRIRHKEPKKRRNRHG